MKIVNQAAICQILKLYPKATTKDYTATVRGYLMEHFDAPDAEWAEGLSKRERQKEVMEMYEDELPPDIRPDLYEIDEADKLIRLFEIEDTHPLSDSKLHKLAFWWWSLDSYGFELELFVTDRYGHNLRKIDLAALFFQIEFELPPNSPLTHQIADEIDVRFDPLEHKSSTGLNFSPPQVLPQKPQSL